MRTLIEVQERKAYLEWFRKHLVYDFQTTPLSRYWYTVATAFFRTLDNEINMLSWMLGEVENTWQDDLSGWNSLLDIVQAVPETRYPHLPLYADYRTHWGKLPRPACRYFFGPDSPKDDQTFDFSRVQDPSTWNRSEFLHLHRYPRAGFPRFSEPMPAAAGRPFDAGFSGPLWMAYYLGEGPRPHWVDGAWVVGE